MKKENVVSIEDRIPKLKQHRKKKANRRLLFLLSLFLLMILSVLYFQSPLSHVKEVTVNGNELISNKAVLQKSGINNDMNVWSVNREKTVDRLKELPEVKDAKVKLSFPNSYEVTIQEYSKKAYLSKGNKFFVILENGKVLE